MDDDLDKYLLDEGEWAPIPGYPGYMVTESGAVWSLKGANFKLMTPYVNPHGYPMIALSDGWKRKTLYIHEIVAWAWLGRRPANAVIRHLDGNSLNNHRSNLQYGTVAENSADTKKHGTLMKGSRHVWARVDETDVLWIREYFKLGYTHVAISRAFQISPSTCASIAKGRSWTHVK